MAIENIICKGRLIAVLESKQDWFRRVPGCLPQKRYAEQRLWVDSFGNALTIGNDFRVAEELGSYPVRVYSLQRVAEVDSPPSPLPILTPEQIADALSPAVMSCELLRDLPGSDASTGETDWRTWLIQQIQNWAALVASDRNIHSNKD